MSPMLNAQVRETDSAVVRESDTTAVGPGRRSTWRAPAQRSTGPDRWSPGGTPVVTSCCAAFGQRPGNLSTLCSRLAGLRPGVASSVPRSVTSGVPVASRAREPLSSGGLLVPAPSRSGRPSSADTPGRLAVAAVSSVPIRPVDLRSRRLRRPRSSAPPPGASPPAAARAPGDSPRGQRTGGAMVWPVPNQDTT